MSLESFTQIITKDFGNHKFDIAQHVSPIRKYNNIVKGSL